MGLDDTAAKFDVPLTIQVRCSSEQAINDQLSKQRLCRYQDDEHKYMKNTFLEEDPSFRCVDVLFERSSRNLSQPE